MSWKSNSAFCCLILRYSYTLTLPPSPYFLLLLRIRESRDTRVRVIFQNRNPNERGDLFASVSAFRGTREVGGTLVLYGPDYVRSFWLESSLEIIAGFGCIELFSVLYYPPQCTRPV